jgi:hypothetical protein
MTKMHEISAVNSLPDTCDWDSDGWRGAEPLSIDNYREEGSSHRPMTEVKVLHDGRTIGMLFRVRDAYVRAATRAFQGPVCRDSCVEFFVRPLPDKGYFNFEMNCSGVLHTSYIEDWTRVGDQFGKRTMLTAEQAQSIRVVALLPSVIDPERAEPMTWTLALSVPLDVMESFVGSLGTLSGATWAGNFYKCGDETSHPHWASWSPVKELNFHSPECFGNLHFL